MTLGIALLVLGVALIAISFALFVLHQLRTLDETVEHNEAYLLRENRHLVDDLRALSHKHDRLLKALGLVEAPTEQLCYVKDSK